jgi:hypothetical protein
MALPSFFTIALMPYLYRWVLEAVCGARVPCACPARTRVWCMQDPSRVPCGAVGAPTEDRLCSACPPPQQPPLPPPGHRPTHHPTHRPIHRPTLPLSSPFCSIDMAIVFGLLVHFTLQVLTVPLRPLTLTSPRALPLLWPSVRCTAAPTCSLHLLTPPARSTCPLQPPPSAVARWPAPAADHACVERSGRPRPHPVRRLLGRAARQAQEPAGRRQGARGGGGRRQGARGVGGRRQGARGVAGRRQGGRSGSSRGGGAWQQCLPLVLLLLRLLVLLLSLLCCGCSDRVPTASALPTARTASPCWTCRE